jgi:D-sedoheptulose 7-phosphate isomerase
MADAAAGALAEHRALLDEVERLAPRVDEVARLLIRAYEAGGRLYSFGNGGSAADAQHLAAELVGRFRRDRRPLPATALSVDPSVVTCIGNDYAFDDLFARQVEAHARPGDVVVGFTTSGRSANVVRGLAAARGLGAATVLFGGGDGPPASDHADHALVVPSATTARVQEMHLLLLHLLLESVDGWAAGEEGA